MKLNALPTRPDLAATLVMAGAWSTVRVKICLTWPEVLVAVNFTFEYTRARAGPRGAGQPVVAGAHVLQGHAGGQRAPLASPSGSATRSR